MLERTLKIPSLSGSEAQALTTLARHAVDLPLPSWPGSEGQTACLSLSCMPHGAGVNLPSSALRMTLEWAGASLWLDFPQVAVDRWLAAALGAAWPQVAQLSQPWQHLAQVQASSWVTQALSQSSRGVAHCIDCQPTASLPEAARHHLLMSVTVESGGGGPADVFHGVLHTDSLGILLVAGLVADHPGQAKDMLDVDSCPQPMTLCVGETHLPLTAVENLQPGQVILVQQRYAQGEQEVCLRSEFANSPWLACQARVNDSSLHILTAVKTMTMPDTLSTSIQSSDTESDHLAHLAHLPVRVSFDLGETVLSLAQVKSLQPGETLELDRAVQEYVTIRANGMPIGTGQLVEIDGRLGVAVGGLSATSPSKKTGE